MADNKALVRKFYEIGDSSGTQADKQAALNAIIAPNFLAHLPGMEPLTLEVFNQMAQVFEKGFSDTHHDIEDQLSDGDRVATRLTWRGKHTGEFQGIAPTNREVKMRVMSIIRVENGKIAEIWDVGDSMSMMRQLGAM